MRFKLTHIDKALAVVGSVLVIACASQPALAGIQTENERAQSGTVDWSAVPNQRGRLCGFKNVALAMDHYHFGDADAEILCGAEEGKILPHFGHRLDASDVAIDGLSSATLSLSLETDLSGDRCTTEMALMFYEKTKPLFVADQGDMTGTVAPGRVDPIWYTSITFVADRLVHARHAVILSRRLMDDFITDFRQENADEACSH